MVLIIGLLKSTQMHSYNTIILFFVHCHDMSTTIPVDLFLLCSVSVQRWQPSEVNGFPQTSN